MFIEKLTKENFIEIIKELTGIEDKTLYWEYSENYSEVCVTYGKEGRVFELWLDDYEFYSGPNEFCLMKKGVTQQDYLKIMSKIFGDEYLASVAR